MLLKYFSVFLVCFQICFAEDSEVKPISSSYFAQHDLCENEIDRSEKKNNIPHRLLTAIATVESGRPVTMSNGRIVKRAWPWTICARGRGYYFSTKSAAIAAVKKLFARGVRNIDVGCMQVNLMHHSKAFKTLEEAFTPKNNVAYATKYFLDLKKMTNSWTNAVGYYHSRTAKHYKRYCSLVFNEWKNVRNLQINSSPVVQRASSEIKSRISFLPNYYSLIDEDLSAKLHKLGRQSITRKPPKFFME